MDATKSPAAVSTDGAGQQSRCTIVEPYPGRRNDAAPVITRSRFPRSHEEHSREEEGETVASVVEHVQARARWPRSVSWKLAAALKDLVPAARNDKAARRRLVMETCRMLDLEFGEVWGEVESVWDRVNGDLIDRAVAVATRHDLPAPADDYPPRQQLLVGICREIHDLAQGNDFILSTRRAATEVLVTQPMAWRYLKTLIADGILELVDPGQGRPFGPAARFRWCWQQELQHA